MLKVTICDIFGNVATLYADSLKQALTLAENHPKLIKDSELGSYLKIIAWH